MRVIDTAEMESLPPAANHQTYCGLDCCLTGEVFEEISTLFNQPPAVYAFSRALQAPYLDIMLRGFLVDQISRHQASQTLGLRIAKLQHRLNELALEVWQKPLNPRSPAQLQDFFYNSMHLPEVWLSQKGVRKLSTNREALEKLDHAHLYARPFVGLILSIRDLSKQKEVLDTAIDSDGRFRTSYNIAGTETGRPSSSENAWGTGGNAQNIAPGLRSVFIADNGYKLCVIDLEQVEARDEGFIIGCLFDDWTFLDSCESGDLHTNNAKLVWPELPWTGQKDSDRQIADRPFYRDFSYRDMAKRGGHLSNYMGTAWTASRALKVPLPIMEEFQARYCRGRRASAKLPEIAPAFPGIPRYWSWVAEQLQTLGWLETPFGRRRHFFGRPGDDATLREAIAFLPQSTTADRTNLGLWRIWRHMPEVHCLAQTYDSVTFQYAAANAEQEADIIGRALELMRVGLTAPNGRSYVVPGEAKIGWNWGNFAPPSATKPNPDGLVKFNPSKPDSRQRQIGLARVMGK